MGAVPEAVHRVVGAGEVLLGGLAAPEVGMGLVHSGVQHGDGDAGAVVAGPPCLGGADLRNAVVEGGLVGGVQPDPLDAVGGERGGAVVPGGEPLPDGVGLLLADADRRAADAGQRPVRTGRGGAEGAAVPAGRVVVGDDERQIVSAVVVVAGPDQAAHVEQAAVQGAGADQGGGVARDDIGVVVVAAHRHGDVRAAVRRVDRQHPALAVGLDPVAGEQRDGVRRRAPGRCPGVRAGRRAGRRGGRRGGRRQRGGQQGCGEHAGCPWCSAHGLSLSGRGCAGPSGKHAAAGEVHDGTSPSMGVAPHISPWLTRGRIAAAGAPPPPTGHRTTPEVSPKCRQEEHKSHTSWGTSG
ncbi:hypothetical protein SAMN05421773_103254 [Streptomyces aidingensis]|uniref:Uncharacterized protein n=1 Tax=Streptomyces aidingensis TaxID=910347 RepID=A0A1I1J8V4_9ACTN|nr:hypothetical protein [Streptomyces aidingensis]SFC42353.1 hypothetical protein SAMN05421773_103254 [Streptomyces aidingensis]